MRPNIHVLGKPAGGGGAAAATSVDVFITGACWMEGTRVHQNSKLKKESNQFRTGSDDVNLSKGRVLSVT